MEYGLFWPFIGQFSPYFTASYEGLLGALEEGLVAAVGLVDIGLVGDLP